MIPDMRKGYQRTIPTYLHSTHGKLYIFGKKTFSFQKYIVCHGYHGHIYFAVIMISPIFPIFRSTLVPFLYVRNHIRMHGAAHQHTKTRGEPPPPEKESAM